MGEPLPGGTALLITVSPVPGKYDLGKLGSALRAEFGNEEMVKHFCLYCRDNNFTYENSKVYENIRIYSNTYFACIDSHHIRTICLI